MCEVPVAKIGILGSFNDQMMQNAMVQHRYRSEDATKGDFSLIEDMRFTGKFRIASGGHPYALCPG